MSEKIFLLTSKSNKSLCHHLGSSRLVTKSISIRGGNSWRVLSTPQVKLVPPLKRFWPKYKYVITAVSPLLGFKLSPPVAFTRAQIESNRIVFGIGGGTDAMKRNSVAYNGPGSLNENGQELFDITSAFNQAQREAGISESLAKELAQNVHQVAKDSINTNLNPFYKLDNATRAGGGIGAAAALKDYVESPKNSPLSTTPKLVIKVAKNPLFYGAFADITTRELRGMSKVTKDIYEAASKEGSRGGVGSEENKRKDE